MKEYHAPQLYVDFFTADTMIASSSPEPKMVMLEIIKIVGVAIKPLVM